MPSEEFNAAFIARLKAGEAHAWEKAFRALYPIAWRGCGHAHWNLRPEDREEAAADALCEVARRMEELDAWSQVTALVFVVARRRAVSRLRTLTARKRRGHEGADLALDDVNEVELAADNPKALKNWADVAAKLDVLVTALGEPAATLVRGYTLEGLTYEQLAARHGMPLGTVGVTLFRSMQRLRRELAASPKLAKELSLYLRLFVLA